MDLKDFVSNTITQIIDGVTDAQQSLGDDSTADISPSVRGNSSIGADLGFVNTSAGAASILNFDIAVEATDGTDTKGGIGVITGFANLGSAGASSASNSSHTRVRFSVPIVLPRINRKSLIKDG